MKRVYIICALSSLFLVLAAFLIHSSYKGKDNNIKVGFIYVGDEITPYTENFISAQRKAENYFGDKLECIVKYNVAEDACEMPLQELVDEGCDFIFATSYGYSPYVKELAAKYPDIQFCVPTGDNANVEPVYSNYHNCMGTIYQGRYICGAVAGMKLKEMIDSGIITPDQAKVGYVAAFPFSEVISGYTAFYLGVQSIVPEATMLVKYTNTWSSYALEKSVAMELIDNNCLVIAQHSDTTGPAVACENAKGEIPVYHVGYNQSMTEIAPTRSLVSCNIDFSHYFIQAIEAVLNGQSIEKSVDARVHGQDTMAGLDKGWIRILDINKAVVADGTEDEIEKISAQLASGSLTVFKGNFTGTNPFDANDKIDLRDGYIENEKTSSPSFKYVLDDVIEILP